MVRPDAVSGARRVALGALCLLLAVRPALARPALARPALAHPLHTSVAELAYDPASRVVRVSLRVFVDDFSAAVTHRRSARGADAAVPPDSAIYRYVAERFVLLDRGGRAAALGWCGTRRAGDLLLVCLQAAVAGPLAGARVRNALLTEIFPDQVNIVQASYAGRRQTLLFTPGDGAKVLP